MDRKYLRLSLILQRTKNASRTRPRRHNTGWTVAPTSKNTTKQCWVTRGPRWPHGWALTSRHERFGRWPDTWWQLGNDGRPEDMNHNMNASGSGQINALKKGNPLATHCVELIFAFWWDSLTGKTLPRHRRWVSHAILKQHIQAFHPSRPGHLLHTFNHTGIPYAACCLNTTAWAVAKSSRQIQDDELLSLKQTPGPYHGRRKGGRAPAPWILKFDIFLLNF